MGIRGLTTFIQNRSHLYMENYELHDSDLIIDGNSIACQIYKWHTSSHDCFGGDYDQFAKSVNDFFDLLKQCNITPYCIFDGGYETRKVATIISRMKNKVKSASQLNPITESSISVFPIFLRKTFEDVVIQRGIKCVRCDFEGDTETANIARFLKCPILSYDSDYFIFDCPYIPFVDFEMSIKRGKYSNNKGYKYIHCKVYRVEKFLKSFEGLQKSSLPILAVLLGNDYVKRGVFTMFYQNLKIQKCHGNQSDQQKRIKSLIIWLQNENIESALKKVLYRYKKAKRKNIMEKIKRAIQGYNCIDSKFLSYLDISPKIRDQPNLDVDLTVSVEDDDDLSETDEAEVEDISEASSDEQELFIDNETDLDLPTEFLEKFRRCIYPPNFMDMLKQNKYYCVSQVENNLLNNSHAVSFGIISAIHKILTNSDNPLICLLRVEKDSVGRKEIPSCNISVPLYKEIATLSLDSRKDVLLRVLNLDNKVLNSLNAFPDSWHLFILAVSYYLKEVPNVWPLIYSIILCKLILSYIDKKIGFYRSCKTFIKKFESFDFVVELVSTNNIHFFLDNISKSESVGFLHSVIKYFEMDYKLTTNCKAFDRNIVHLLSQFQSCLLNVVHLNILLDFPFLNVTISDILNCTFIYNLTNNLQQRTNLDEYMKVLLKDAPNILNGFNLIVSSLKDLTNVDVLPQQTTKKKRKKNKKKKLDLDEEFDNLQIETQTEEHVIDPNNKFTLLGCL